MSSTTTDQAYETMYDNEEILGPQTMPWFDPSYMATNGDTVCLSAWHRIVSRYEYIYTRGSSIDLQEYITQFHSKINSAVLLFYRRSYAYLTD